MTSAIGSDIAIGDFNADNLSDIATTYAGFMTIFFGDGGGGFPTSTSIPPPPGGGGLNNLAVADFNGDGVSDIAVSTGGEYYGPTGFLVLYLQTDGGFVFSPLYSSVTSMGSELSIRVADFNGDGHPDVAILNDYFGVDVFPALLDGGFASPTRLPLPSDQQTYQSLAAGDVNGDGLADLVISAFTVDAAVTDLDAVYVFLQQGGGLELAGETAASRFVRPSIADEQVYLFSDCDIGVSRFLDGGLSPVSDLAVSCGLAWGGATGDFNGDGLPDLVVVDPYSSYLYVFLAHEGGTSYGAPALVSTGLDMNGLFGEPLAVGDLNGDSRPDVAVTGQNGTSVLINNCPPQ